MDHFEGIIRTLLEHDGYWVRQSFKVNLTKEEKRDTGKPSIPRPEIDLLAYRPHENCVLALEVKSYLDSPGVRVTDLALVHDIAEGRYKLFTCENYRNIVTKRLALDLVANGMCAREPKIRLGLIVGKVYQARSEDLRTVFNNRGWLFWSPEDVRDKVKALAAKDYENDPAIIAAKILMRSG